MRLRSPSCVRPVLGLCVLVAGMAAPGCRTVLTTAAYLIKGTDIDAEFDGLRDKKSVVVCRPATSLSYRDPGVAGDLARQVGSLLRDRVRKAVIVDHQQVAEWADMNQWSEYPEVGEALNSDMVVGIDLLDFSLYEGQTVYQGRATVAVRVYDCTTETPELVFERELPQVVYPPNAPIPTTSRSESEFRRKFLQVLADHVGRHFYPHDAYADYAMDATALDR